MALRVHHGEDDLEEVHEINVTPFIDVMLVLLIIFMVAAPLATVDLPVSTAEPQPRELKPIFLTLKADRTLALAENLVADEEIGAALDAASGNDKEQRIFLRADKQVDYGALMELMNKLRAAGYLKVALVGLESRQGSPQAPQ